MFLLGCTDEGAHLGVLAARGDGYLEHFPGQVLDGYDYGIAELA